MTGTAEPAELKWLGNAVEATYEDLCLAAFLADAASQMNGFEAPGYLSYSDETRLLTDWKMWLIDWLPVNLQSWCRSLSNNFPTEHT